MAFIFVFFTFVLGYVLDGCFGQRHDQEHTN